MVKKAPKKDKNKFSAFYNLFYIFPLPLRKKTKPFTFPPFVSPEIGKPQGKMSHEKFFFFFFFFFFFYFFASYRSS